MHARIPAVLTLLAASALALCAADSEAQRQHDRQLLQQANLTEDGKPLLEFFSRRTLDDAARQRLADLIRQLGDDDFETREAATKALTALGLAAEPALQAAATDADVERANRAKECLAALGDKRVGCEVLAAAARRLATLNPPRTIEILLAYLPSAHDRQLEDEIVGLLAHLGSADGLPAPLLAAAAQDSLPIRRLAAVQPLVHAGGEHRTAARKLLQDPEPRVRLAAALALVAARDRSAVPTLIALLGEGPLPLFWAAEDRLCQIAGADAPALSGPPTTAATRLKYRAAWSEWWQANEAKAELVQAVRPARPLGLTVVCDFDGGASGEGQVWEYGADGKANWKIDGVQGPADVQVLPTGRLLIAEHNSSRLTERNRDGQVIWEYGVTGNPVSAQSLPNGNIFFATYTELAEVTREGKKVWSHQKPHSIYCAQLLPNRHILYIHSNGNIVELDALGKEVRSVPAGNTSGWGSVELLPNGHFLIALYNTNKVREIDENGKVYLECSVSQATFATRLANGHTLAADSQNRQIIEFDQLGKVVSRQAVPGRPFRVRRR
ncbi:MAG: PQQ-binding-like beta-propeller repeat protein [Planctomycetia bacterium]|nr:PQQ-binding-like beta-propeller repeat protein [Planctomycetia bacterium]